MSEKEPTEDDYREIVHSILAMRESGMTRRQIVEEFVKAGVEEENAKDLVKTVLTSQRRAQSNAGSGVPGIVWYIGILLLINVLSFVFDLGFIVY